MQQFSGSDAALTGFRFVREHLRTVGIWAAIHLVISAIIMVVMVQTAGPALTQMMATAGTRPDPAEAMARLRQLAPFYGCMMLYGLFFYSVLYAAMSRAVLRPGDERYAYLRLGPDELRQGLLILLCGVFGMAVYVCMLVLVVVLAIAVGLTLGKGAAAVAVVGIAFLAGLCGMVYLWVRLSLASPLTFDRGRVNLFGSWALTRGRFWKLLGCYLMVVGLSLALFLLFAIIFAAVAMVLGGVDGLAFLFRPDMSSLGAYFTAPRLVLVLLGAFASAMMWPVMLMPPAEIYAQITEGDA